MTRNRFFAADLHLGHSGMIRFARNDGKPLRPWGRALADGEIMSEAEEIERTTAMDEAMIENWNSVVKEFDKVEVLGDVIIGRKQRKTLSRLNGKKRLRMGNHDIFLKDYAEYFEEVSAYKVFDDLICSHIPLHEESVKERWKANVHGHLHSNRVMMRNPAYDRWLRYGNTAEITPPSEIINPRYFCVSMEHINYTPMHIDEVYARIAAQQEAA